MMKFKVLPHLTRALSWMLDFYLRIRPWVALAGALYMLAFFAFTDIIQEQTITGDPMKDFVLALFMAALMVICIYLPEVALFAKTLSGNAAPTERSAPILVKHYAPPYPNVWGYDLRKYPPMVRNEGKTDFYLMPNGEVGIIFNAEFKTIEVAGEAVEVPSRYGLLKFFSGELTFLNGKELNEFYRQHEKEAIDVMPFHNPRYPFYGIQFQDGTQYRLDPGFKEFSGYPYLGALAIELDSIKVIYPNHEIKSKLVPLYFLEKPETMAVKADGEFYDQTFRLEILGGPFIPLQDDTFLVLVEGRILRLKRDFSTDFPGFEHYFVVLSQKRLDELLEQARKLGDDAHFIEKIVRDIQDHANQRTVKKS